MHYQIADRVWKIQDLPFPNDPRMLIDTEYADDTMVYVKGDANNLDIYVKGNAIDELWRGSCAKIDLNKSVGIWINNKSVLNWASNLNFC